MHFSTKFIAGSGALFPSPFFSPAKVGFFPLLFNFECHGFFNVRSSHYSSHFTDKYVYTQHQALFTACVLFKC